MHYIFTTYMSADSNLFSLGEVLKAWREKKGFTLYAIAKFEGGMRVEPLKRIENGEHVDSANLLKYLDFVRCHDPNFDAIKETWKMCGYGVV